MIKKKISKSSYEPDGWPAIAAAYKRRIKKISKIYSRKGKKPYET